MKKLPDHSSDIMFAIHRLGYGPRAEEYDSLVKQSLAGWLEEQLAAPESEQEVSKRLDACTIRIKYEAAEGKWSAVDEMRPLTSLSKPIEDIWRVFDPQKPMPVHGYELSRPRVEVLAATLIRSVYSHYQLREVICQFWHDHFHVNAFAEDRLAAALPVYDRDVIRKHCFGNFRAMLEAVACSTSMQYYLSNQSSRAGAANENYARELFELHSFGRENYLNDIYNRWRDVPGALVGKPVGYIDQDIYETARAFTGWTIEDGRGIDNYRKLPFTGRFTYVESWHDGNQKRILATEFDPYMDAMADGRKVLDLIAAHPATAQHMAHKLCTRLLGANPPASLTARVAEAWRSKSEAPDQIAQILRLIILSPEFLQSRGRKIKRPLALMANYLRVMGTNFTPNETLVNQLTAAGQRLFGAPTPEGIPDDNNYFMGTNAMRNRWNLILGLAQNTWGNGISDPAAALTAWGGKTSSNREAAADWFRLLGVSFDPKWIDMAITTAGLMPSAPLSLDNQKGLAMVSALAALSPDFQNC